VQFFSEIHGVERLISERDACAIEHYISRATMAKLIGFLASLTTPSQLRFKYGQKKLVMNCEDLTKFSTNVDGSIVERGVLESCASSLNKKK
jgi:Mn-dependent DtxR family transcriptional regulator